MTPGRRAAAAWWPMPPLFFVLPALLIAGLVLAETRAMPSWRALDWTFASAQAGELVRIPVTVSAAAAAALSARLTRRRLVFAQPWQPRAGLAVAARHLGLLLGWFLGAYLLGLAPLAAATALRAGYGAPDPLAVAGALAGFAALTAVGYLAGAALQNLLAVPVATAVVFAAVNLSLAGDAWSAVTPAMPVVPTLGMVENPALGAYRLGFMLVLGAVAVWAASSLLTVRAPVPWAGVRGLATAGAAAAAVAALAALPHLNPPALLRYAPAGPEVCTDRGGVRYCVHGGHRSELPVLADLAAPVFAAYGGAPGPPREVRDLSLARGDGDVLRRADRGVLWMPITPGWEPAAEVPQAAAASLVPDVRVCGSDGVASLDPGAGEEQRRAAVLAELESWLAARAGADVGAGGGAVAASAREDGLFAGVSEERVRAWTADDGEAIAACAVAPEDLPWSR